MTMIDENGSDEVRPKEVSISSVNAYIKNTGALKKVNKQVLQLLDRLPLEDQRDIVKLNRLIEEQEKLVRVGLGGSVPLRISVFNENERYRAVHLGKRFRHAQRRDKIRKTD